MRIVRHLGLYAAIAIAATPAVVPAQPADARVFFDVASIRLSGATDGHHHIYNDPGNSHFRAVNLSVRELLQFAYGLPQSQISGGPPWLDTTAFDVDAKADPSVDAELHAMSSEQARRRKQEMVQALLKDRFQLATHLETRELPTYALIVAKGGAKFQPSAVGGTTIDTGHNRIHVQGSDDTLSLLTRELAQTLGRVVVDKTGLVGRYDLTLRWTPADAPPPMLNGQPDPTAPPDLFTAIQEQLGLKLESTRSPVPILIVDRASQPSEN